MPAHTYVTHTGLPLSIELHWPFHLSHGGADFYVLHGRATLEDGSGRYAELAIQMSQTVHSALSSEAEAACAPAAINAVRKSCDVRDIEFTKSSKKQPIALSSRQYSIVQKRFTFHDGDAAQLSAHIRRTVYWKNKLNAGPMRLTDPVETLYYHVDAAAMLAAARELDAHKLITLHGEDAIATDALIKQASEFETAMQKAIEELEAKHAFEKA